jgi:hypothetical protein
MEGDGRSPDLERSGSENLKETRGEVDRDIKKKGLELFLALDKSGFEKNRTEKLMRSSVIIIWAADGGVLSWYHLATSLYLVGGLKVGR